MDSSTTFSLSYCSQIFSRSVNSLRHGGQWVSKKLRITTFPFKLSSETVLPSMSLNSKRGAGSLEVYEGCQASQMAMPTNIKLKKSIRADIFPLVHPVFFFGVLSLFWHYFAFFRINSNCIIIFVKLLLLTLSSRSVLVFLTFQQGLSLIHI